MLTDLMIRELQRSLNRSKLANYLERTMQLTFALGRTATVDDDANMNIST